jgi:hypothetical protein
MDGARKLDIYCFLLCYPNSLPSRHSRQCYGRQTAEQARSRFCLGIVLLLLLVLFGWFKSTGAGATGESQATIDSSSEGKRIKAIDARVSGADALAAAVSCGDALFLNAAPQDGHVFLTWNQCGSSAGYSYDLYWRPVGGTPWNKVVVHERAQYAVTNLVNDLEYEFYVTLAGSKTVRSRITKQTPRVRADCSSPGFFCSQQEADRWLRSIRVDPLTLHCRGKPIETWDLNAPNCYYASDDFSLNFLLLRSADSVFNPPPDRLLGHIRSLAVKAIWPNTNPFDNPENFSAEVQVVDPPIIGAVTAFAEAKSYTIKYDLQLSSRITWFTPPQLTIGYAIYHEGHGGSGVDIGSETINWLLERGWVVINIDMPLIGANAVDISSDLQVHNDLMKLDTGDNSPVGLFLLPVKHVVDMIVGAAHNSENKTKLIMIGRSGGGWTTTLYGAIDQRIDVAIPVAGVIPMSLRLLPGSPGDLGDYEQSAPHVYDVVTYEDLMKATGSLGSLYMYNFHDPCCYEVSPDSEFVKYLESASEKYAKVVEVWVDEENYQHSISPQGYVILEQFINMIFSQDSVSVIKR